MFWFVLLIVFFAWMLDKGAQDQVRKQQAADRHAADMRAGRNTGLED